MKNRIVAAIILLLLFIIACAKFTKLKEENKKLSSNQNSLLLEREYVIAESQRYKVNDSLNAVKISALRLSLNDYEKFRNEDSQIIKQLKDKKANLEKIISAQTETIANMATDIKTVIITDTIDNTPDTIKYFEYKSKWSDAKGYIMKDSITLQIKNRESIKIIEAVKYKRFLGFLWKTKKIKERKINALSENPNTIITNIEYINVEK